MRGFAALRTHIRQLNERIAGLSFRVSALETALREASKKGTTGELSKRSLIHEAIAKTFDVGELQSLAFSLGVNYDDLSGDGLTEKALHLALYMQRRGRFRNLLSALATLRPRVDWSEYE